MHLFIVGNVFCVWFWYLLYIARWIHSHRWSVFMAPLNINL